jgi:hypothetical protein
VAEPEALPAAAVGHQVDEVKLAEWQKQRKLVAGDVGSAPAQPPLSLPLDYHMQQQAQQHLGAALHARQQPAAALATAGCPLQGLARIQQILGRQINPAALAAHLGARQQQVAGSSTTNPQ